MNVAKLQVALERFAPELDNALSDFDCLSGDDRWPEDYAAPVTVRMSTQTARELRALIWAELAPPETPKQREQENRPGHGSIPSTLDSAVEHFNKALREMRSRFDGTRNPTLQDDDLHRWVSWLTEVEWRLNHAGAAGKERNE